MSNRLNVDVVGALLATLLLWASAPPESPVADAAMRGDADEVRTLLQDGADVNAAQGDGMTALHWAAENGDSGLAEMLLQAGANVASVTRLGDYTPLHLASKAGGAEAVEALLSGGADPEALTTTGGAAPLHFAVRAGGTATVVALLDHGADPDVRETMWLQTPLMFAAAAGRTDVVNALLERGADPSLTARVLDLAQREAEDGADRQRESQIIEQIRAAVEDRPVAEARLTEQQRLAAGYPPSIPGQQAARGRQGGQQQPGARGGGGGRGEPGARGGQQGLTRDEINQAQRDRRPTGRLSHAQLVGGYGGLSALLLAAREGHFGAAMALVDGGADIDQVSGGDHTPPLLMATINGHFDLAMRLFERGADPNVSSDAGATPLYTTLNTQWIPKSRHPQPADYMQQEVGYLELMRAFLEAGVDVNLRLEKQLWYTTFGDDYLRTDRMGATAFWRAAYALDVDAMKLLFEYGADPNIPTMKTAGRAYGGGAAGSADIEAPRADPSGLPPVPEGGPGVYPIHAATGVGYGEGFAANIHRVVPDGWLAAVKFLVEEVGADVTARDHNGYNPVHHAAARGDDEVIRYLISKGAYVMAVSRQGQTTVDMANGPVQRINPFPSTIALLESLGAINNHNCVACE